jgi:solute carrier family 25 S-adenosylmethionine transporter 26
MPAGAVAFVAGGAGALGGSVVKVPLAVCIRSVQAGIYPSARSAAASIVAAAGVRGLFTGYLPTLLEDVPDMAFKFATYESLRAAHTALTGRRAGVGEELAMGATAGAVAAAATTPLDVVKTNMMCAAAARPSMRAAARQALAAGGPAGLFRGVGPRALSNGLNSAIFFAFFSALRTGLAARKAAAEVEAQARAPARAGRARRAAA